MKKANLQELMLQVLTETVAFYGENPSEKRSKNDGHCYYLSASGKRCAMGRLLDERYTRADLSEFEGKDSSCIPSYMIKKEYKELSTDFLVELQILHDSNKNWNSSEISEIGAQKVELIKQDIIGGEYSY